MATESHGAAAAAEEIVATRVFDAEPGRVFDMWTDAEHLANWWGPRGFSITTREFDARPGGVWDFVMHGPDGADYKNRIVYVEVARPERIVYEHVSGPKFLARATFVDLGGRTEVQVRMRFETVELRDRVATEFGAVEGLGQTLDRLGELLAGEEAR